MASHLTITAKPAMGASTTKGFNAQAGSDADSGAPGTFAAMLGESQPASDVKDPAKSKLEMALDKLAALALGTGEGDQPAPEAEDPEAVAAVVDAAQPIRTTEEAKAMLADLVKGLATLKQALDAGEPVDPETLERVNKALEGLAATFNIDLSAQPSLKDLTTLVTAATPAQHDGTAQLTAALAPLAQSLLAGEAGPSASAELSAAVKAVGEKLVTLLQSLNSDEVSPDQKAALGLKLETGFEGDLKDAIARLVAPTPKLDAGANAPVLATATLKLTEPSLTGKADPTAAAAATPAPPASADSAKPAAATPDSDSGDAGKNSSAGDTPVKLAPVSGTPDKADDKPADNAKRDDKPIVAAPAAASDTRTDAQAATAAPHVARVDAVAPRVIQAGYQTSQQQLNLPQLAFELVRQVNEGNTRFQMRLDPPELGRIDVKLDIDKSGQINARLVVEKSETLDLMQRDQRALERALQQAGLDAGKTNLEFSLKQNPFGGGQQQARDDQGQQFRLDGPAIAEIEEAPPIINLYRGSLTASGVNIIA